MANPESKSLSSQPEKKAQGKYQYKEWWPIPARPGYGPGRIQIPYCGAEDPNVLAIESPSQPGDDDCLLIIWDKDRKIWTQHYGFCGSYHVATMGFDERAAITLLEYFDILDKAEEFFPSQLMSMSPEEIEVIKQAK